jgi:hypothetical protein
MTTAQDVIDKAENVLQDILNARWGAPELLGWYNDGQKAIVVRKPDAYVKNEAFVLIAGTRQSVPGFVVIDIVRNMGTAGTAPGDAITKIDRAEMDLANPSWHTDVASATVKHWMYDDRDPSRFWVYPPQPGSAFGFVDAIWSAAPPDALLATAMALNAVYEPVLIDWILFRAYSKDAANSLYSRDRAVAHAQMFLAALGSQESAEAMVSASAAE